MNTRRKFLQMTSLLTATSVVAKSANAFQKKLVRVEEKLLGKSLRKLSIAHTQQASNTLPRQDKIVVTPNVVSEDLMAANPTSVVKVYEKGLLKTGVIYGTAPALQHGVPKAAYLQELCAKAAKLKKEDKCQTVVVYLNMPMPDSKKITDKDFWLAGMHSVDVLFTQADKQKNFARVCQDKNRNELIIAPLHNKENAFGGMDFMFDVGLSKSGVHIA
jgi:hypothetical protein